MTYNPESATHQGAIEIAVTWLSTLHRKGWQNAFMNLYQKLLSEDDLAKLATLDADVIQSIEININEWLLAEGDINARGGIRRINDYLLSPAGPRLNAVQRDWIQQLGQRPLRLYDVTDVVPGQQMRRGSKVAVFGYHWRELSSLKSSGFCQYSVNGRRCVSPALGQARRGCGRPNPSSVSQCG